MTPVLHPAETAPARPGSREPEPKKSATRWPWIVGASLAIVIAGAAAVQFWKARPQVTGAVVQRAPVQRGTLKIHARLSGNTAAREFVNITAPLLRGPESDNPMVLVEIKEGGQPVKQGEVVASFDPQGMRDHLDDTRDGLQNRENVVAKSRAVLQLEKDRLRQKLLTAKATLDKARLDLRTVVVRSAIQAEIFRLAVEEAEALHKAVLDEVKLQGELQRATLRIDEIDRDLEVLHVKRHETDLTRLVLRSPTSGLMTIEQQRRGSGDRQPYAVGDRLNPGTLFARVVNPESMLVEASVNQSELEQFSVGQEATVRLDAFPGSAFKAKVTSIGALATRGGGREQFYVRTVPVTLQILGADPRLLPGLSVSADVLIQTVEDTLLAPSSAVDSEGGKLFVHVETPQGVEKRPVSVGATDGSRVEILEGVEEGEVLLLR